MKFQKRDIIIFSIGVLLTLAFSPFFKSLVSAEQSGTTPNSGATSYIKQLYDSLVSLGNGSDSSGSWGDWGGMWNRIRSSSEWVPSGDATAGDVVTGKTFYGNSRTQMIGTGPEPIDFSLFQYSARDDYAGAYYTGLGPEDYQGEEAEWTDHSVDADVVWKDERAGMYWTADRGILTANNFTMATCQFFTSEPRSSYDGSDLTCGGTAEEPHAINYCATLDYGGRTDWYLPSQKELMMAYIDGMYNQAGATPAEAAAFTYGTSGGGGYRFWSSSELSLYPASAWYVNLNVGYTHYNSKTNAYAVRCVARD